MSLVLQSDAFVDQHRIPVRCTGDGADVSPALAWDGVPKGTVELTLVCDDPDSPTPQPWVHWVLCNIPADCRRLPEGLSTDAARLAALGVRQGRNSWASGRVIGYRGPAPPRGHGVHHYHFRLTALDAAVDLPEGVTAQELQQALQGHTLATGEIVGLYSR